MISDPTRRYVLYKDEKGLEEERSFLSDLCGSDSSKTKEQGGQDVVFGKRSIFQTHQASPSKTQQPTNFLPHNHLVIGRDQSKGVFEEDDNQPVSSNRAGNGGLFGVCLHLCFFLGGGIKERITDKKISIGLGIFCGCWGDVSRIKERRFVSRNWWEGTRRKRQGVSCDDGWGE